jgi:hypothetical protein
MGLCYFNEFHDGFKNKWASFEFEFEFYQAEFQTPACILSSVVPCTYNDC